MRHTIIAAATLAAVLGLAGGAKAEETTVVKRDSGPDVTVERRDEVERRAVTTDCGSKTVHKEDGAGNSTTVHKEGC